MKKTLDPEDVFLGGKHVCNVFRPVYVAKSLLCFIPAAIVTILWHSIFANIIGFLFVFLGSFVFMTAWQEIVESSYAPKNQLDQRYTVRLEGGQITSAWLFFIPLTLATVYFVLAQI